MVHGKKTSYSLKHVFYQTFLFDATVVSPLSLLFFGREVRSGHETLSDGTRYVGVIFFSGNFTKFSRYFGVKSDKKYLYPLIN